MHFLGKRGTDLGELHEASYFIKTDFMRGAALGLFLGALGGVVLASIVVNYPPEGTHPGRRHRHGRCDPGHRDRALARNDGGDRAAELATQAVRR